MCGIAGIINHNDYDLNAVKSSLFHRGPDDQSIFIENNLALVHTRLAIQDVLNGKQPVHYGHCSIIFNGEIYNHMELRSMLADFHFKTHSDTETLLYLYLKYGENMFSMLDGMFAFCIYDRNKNCLILARDRSGKKPLYYTTHHNSFLFASELNAIKTMKSLDISEDAINCYLRAGFIFKHYTPYKKVYELEAATYMTVNLENLARSSRKYFNMMDAYYNRLDYLSFNDALEDVEKKLTKSIQSRLLSSDIEVGTFLSGGIDSNLIAAIASQAKANLKTFTVKFDGLYDESSLARLGAKKYQTLHTEIEIDLDVKNDIQNILTFYGEPFMDSSAIPSYYVAKEAKKHVTVILNGDGGDELFGGYKRYVPFAINLLNYVKPVSFFTNFLPAPRSKRNIYTHIHRLLSMSRKTGLDFYLSATTNVYEDIVDFQDNPILNEMNEFIQKTFMDNKLSFLSKMLYLDFNLLLFSDLLVKMDIATMANSLEARSPFLSHHLLQFAPSLPDNYKINKFTTKYLLRVLAKKYLPKQLINQPKRGFEVPLKRWIEIDLKDSIHDSLSSGCYAENYINKNFLSNLLLNKTNVSSERRAKILWSLFCLETWYKNEKKWNATN